MFCMFCGKEIQEDSIFCTYCGKPLKENASSNQKKRVFKKLSISFNPSPYFIVRHLTYPSVILSFISVAFLLYRIYEYTPSQHPLINLVIFVFLGCVYLLILVSLNDKINPSYIFEAQIKPRKTLLIVSCIALVFSISLFSIQEIKRENIINSPPSNGNTHVKASIDVEFYTTLSEGYVTNPYYHIVLDEVYVYDEDIVKISLDKKYNSTIKCSYRGSSNRQSGEGSICKSITISSDSLKSQRPTKVEVKLNSSDTAVMTISFEWCPTFWEVLAY